MNIDTITTENLAQLTKQRQPGSISLYVASVGPRASDERAPIVHDTEAARLALRSALTGALAELEEIGVDRADRDRISEAVRALEDDRAFWATQARTIAVFASPEKTHAFRLRNELPQHTAVGDRFDVGPLVRATTFAHSGYVLAITEGDVRLLMLESDASSRKIELSSLPEDAADVLENSVTSGRFDRHSADGTLGPKVEQRRYCSIIQDAVLDVIVDPTAPLVLSAASDLEPAYREVNTHKGLLEKGIDANPTSLSLEDLESRGRAILDEHYSAGLAVWREDFGTKRANGKASADLSDVARAATAGQVDTLLFDLESYDEGSIDDAGVITFADAPGPTTYGLLDEVAARVLRTGGTVKAVRRADLPDDAALAATFRSAQ